VANINIQGDVRVGRLEFVVQLAMILGLCVAAAWLWPDDLLGSPMSAITFPEVLRVISTPGLLAAAAAWLYLLVTPPVKSAEQDSIVEPHDDTAPHLGATGYRGR